MLTIIVSTISNIQMNYQLELITEGYHYIKEEHLQKMSLQSEQVYKPNLKEIFSLGCPTCMALRYTVQRSCKISTTIAIMAR